jgi:hypothetical protein
MHQASMPAMDVPNYPCNRNHPALLSAQKDDPERLLPLQLDLTGVFCKNVKTTYSHFYTGINTINDSQ